MTDYVKIEDGVFAQTATPDPTRTFSTEELQEEIVNKQREVTMYEQEITSLTERKAVIEDDIVKMQALLDAEE